MNIETWDQAMSMASEAALSRSSADDGFFCRLWRVARGERDEH